MRRFYTSDLHFGHLKVANLRGYATVEEHDAAIVRAWEADVQPEDTVWILGDLAMREHIDALATLVLLPGRKHLISGNHDPVHPMHRRAETWQGAYLHVFESVSPFARHKIDGRDVMLSHFPYRRDRGEPRHMQYRLRDEGAWLLHGHTHGRERLTPHTREVHVGWDAWGRLAPLEAIAGIIDRAEEDHDRGEDDHP